MLRLFSALLIVLGMFALAGCQSTTQQQPVAPTAMEVNETSCCSDDGTCGKECMHECKKKNVTCAKHHHHVVHHHHHHHHHHKAKAAETAAQPAAAAPEAQPAAAPAAQ